jgi:hypothetical protein
MDRFIVTLSIFLVVISFHHIVAPTARGSMWTWRSEMEFYQKVHDAIGPDQYLLAMDELRQLKARASVFTNIAFNQALYLPSTWEALFKGYREVVGADLDDLSSRAGALRQQSFLDEWVHWTSSEWNVVAKENSIGALISTTALPFQFDTSLSVGSELEVWLYRFPISGPSIIQAGGD